MIRANLVTCNEQFIRTDIRGHYQIILLSELNYFLHIVPQLISNWGTEYLNY